MTSTTASATPFTTDDGTPSRVARRAFVAVVLLALIVPPAAVLAGSRWTSDWQSAAPIAPAAPAQP